MAVQLIIDGEHITDVLAQVHTLANATGAAPVKNEVGATSKPSESTTSAPSKPAPEKSEAATGGKPDKPKPLSREEQDEAVEGMIAVGKKDDRFELLTKGRQKAVDDGIAAKAKKDDAPADDLEDMFGDDDAEEEIEITADTIREMMGKLGKDEDGQPIQENLLKIRAILEKSVPKGEEIKVGKIPADKLKAVYAQLKELEA